tara:strand:- start:150 stop:1043 length:894 start_codon:yes stop_codon:yes gene_type:complete
MDFIKNDVSNDRLEPEPSVLYVVGTPIGNLEDISIRAKSILSTVSVIACEDTRRSGLLLKRIGTSTPLLSFHKHNAKSKIPKILELLKSKKSLALISDAGIPGISDPGEELVSAVRKKGFEVICIPGACAATTALVASGLPCKRFCFEGFPPNKTKERKEFLELVSKEERTIVIFESPHRLLQLLEELSKFCGEDRPLHLCRELTKRFEQHIGNTIGQVLKYYENRKPQGEFTLVLGGHTKEELNKRSDSELLNEMQGLIKEGYSPSESVRLTSKNNDLSRRGLYELLHKVSKNDIK